jgi:hypothetical protein
MRVWLQKQKKKEEAKAAAQAATPPAEVTSAAPEVQPVGDRAEKPVESVEEKPKAEDGPVEEAAPSAETAGDAEEHAGSASAQPNEVGFRCISVLSHIGILASSEGNQKLGDKDECLEAMKNIAVTCANDYEVLSASPSSLLTPLRIPPPRSKPSDAAVPLPTT